VSRGPAAAAGVGLRPTPSGTEHGAARGAVSAHTLSMEPPSTSRPPGARVTPALELREVVKRFGDVPALGPVSLQVAQGERLALVGPSGSGKSTALRLLMGLLAPDGGAALLQGLPIGPGDWERRRRLGYVVQGGGLFPHFTAAGNVTLVARHLRWAPRRIAERLADLAALARISPELLGRYPRELSGGQAQRVSLMRALMLEPEVLLLDEPLGALDPITRAELQRDLRAVVQALGKTMILVTHDLAEAAYLADRVALLREGRVVQVAPLATLRSDPADPYVTRFLEAQRPLPGGEG
jgi:osmoprotectant transport system ATP-binding protein